MRNKALQNEGSIGAPVGIGGNRKACRVYLVGPMPPPVHGASVMFDAVRARLETANVPLEVIDVSAANLDRSWNIRVKRVSRVLRGVVRFVRSRPRVGDALFMSVSGGLGKLYELVFAAVARRHGLRIFLRHCSYAYLDRQSWLARCLITVAGGNATHVVLSEKMGAQLRKTYPACTRVLVVSNAALIEPTIPAVVRIRESLKSIGFLSNVSEEKGIFDFLGVVRQLERTSSGLVAKLAGPFDDATTEARVREWLKSLLSVEYLGPQYAKQKSAFFDNLDVLLFPTRYANEASPVTLHEAMAYGVPVIAYGRGSIDELVVDGCGLVIGKDEDFVKQAVRQLEIWKSSPQTFQQASHAARDQFDRICSLSRRQWAALQAELC